MESTLAAQFKDMKADVGHFLGYGRGEDYGDEEWTESQDTDIARCVKGGMRLFYYCGHVWSFLKPVSTLTLKDGKDSIDLPADCGSIDGCLYVTPASSNGSQWAPLQLGPIGAVLSARAKVPSTTGWPEIVAEEPLKMQSVNTSQSRRLAFWPTADQDFTIKLTYNINPDYLSGLRPYAYGGPQHAETLLRACLSIAEELIDDQPGVNADAFVRLLAVSIDIDRRNKPSAIGYNRDMSDGKHDLAWPYQHGRASVTINGAAF